jgi:hypothetical protein
VLKTSIPDLFYVNGNCLRGYRSNPFFLVQMARLSPLEEECHKNLLICDGLDSDRLTLVGDHLSSVLDRGYPFAALFDHAYRIFSRLRRHRTYYVHRTGYPADPLVVFDQVP